MKNQFEVEQEIKVYEERLKTDFLRYNEIKAILNVLKWVVE